MPNVSYQHVAANVRRAIVTETPEEQSARLAEEATAMQQANVMIRWAASALKGKTPQEIFTLVQGQIDGITSLAEAKAFLRQTVPLLTAAMAWCVMEAKRE